MQDILQTFKISDFEIDRDSKITKISSSLYEISVSCGPFGNLVLYFTG